MIADFTARIKAGLGKRRAHLLEALVKSSRDDHDRVAGQIVGIDHALSDIDAMAHKFLVDEDSDEAPTASHTKRRMMA